MRLSNVTMQFMDGMPELQGLDCNNCRGINWEYLAKVLKTSPKLRSLKILDLDFEKYFDEVNAIVLARDNAIPLEISTSWLYKDNGFSPLLKINLYAEDYHRDIWAYERLDGWW